MTQNEIVKSRQRRSSPEIIAARLREQATAFNATYARAKAAGLEIEVSQDSFPEIHIVEIRINKTI